MGDQYDTLREIYDNFVKAIVPTLTIETVDDGVDAVNMLVRLQRPVDWAFTDEPRAVLGITSDKEKVAYGEGSRFGFYHALPFGELHQRVEEMVGKARTEYEENKGSLDTFCRRVTSERLQHVESLLEDLVALRSK